MEEFADLESKTEEATEKKIATAIEEGNVPFSREATSFASLAALLLISALLLKDRVAAIAVVLAHVMEESARWPLANTADEVSLLVAVVKAIAGDVLPIFLVLMVAGLAATFALGIPRFAPQRLQPKFSRISPKAGLQRLLGRQGQMEFLKNCGKFTIISLVVAVLLNSEKQLILDSLFKEPALVPNITLDVLIRLVSAVCVAYSLLTVGDLVWARVQWQRSLRMTRQEVKEELRQSEGDPLFKAKRRSIALDRSRRRMLADVPRATMVIANPTHYAIALRYKRDEGGAPMVLAKGVDLIALKIRAIAESENIPVIEDKALARSMYDQVEVSKMIPPEFYKAVAEIVHFLHVRDRQRMVQR